MNITSPQRAMLDGRAGWAKQVAMQILVAVGEANDAGELIPVRSVHLGLSSTTLGEAGLELLEKMATEPASFVVPTTTNVLSFDRRKPDASAGATLQGRIAAACEKMGALLSCSCNPFIQGFLPARGESVAWSESATAPFVNSVLGARTNREGATALASALTGLTPRYGMHVDADRLAGVRFEIETPLRGLDEYHLLGVAIGRRCRGRIPVIQGLKTQPTRDELVGLSAALASHSTVAMFHAVGITPEAGTIGAATPHDGLEVITLGRAELEEERERMCSALSGNVEVVVVGCPHASLAQISELSSLFAGKRLNDGVRFYVHTNIDAYAAADDAGAIKNLSDAGVCVTTDTCSYVSHEPFPSGTTLATNSAKMALLMRNRGLDIYFGSVAQCVAAAIMGAWNAAQPVQQNVNS